jgi:ankyrin repeat protein
MKNRCFPVSRLSSLLLAAGLFASCDNPQKVAKRELSKQGIEPTGQALVNAVTEKNAQKVEWLVDLNVGLEQKDAKGKTPLRIAIENKDSAAIAKLLTAKADVNATTEDKVSVLGVAVQHCDEATVDKLLSAGARVTGLMLDGEEMIPWAVRHDRQHFIQKVIKSAEDARAKDRVGNSLLHIAMSNGQRKLAEILIDRGADPATLSAAGETTVHHAIEQNWLDLLPQLTSRGADPDARNAKGFSLLDLAVTEKNAEKVAALLKAGADPNSRDPKGKLASPLLRVFNSGDAKLLQVFLDHKVSPPKDSWDSWLWQAFKNRHPHIADQLLKHGAQASQLQQGGLSLIDAAVQEKQAAFVKVLLANKVPTGNAFCIACGQGDQEMVNVLMSHGAPVNQVHSISKDTPLNTAIRNKHDHIAAMLIEKGASSTQLFLEGQSALHLAIATGCEKTTKLLLDKGADPNSQFILPITEEFRQCVRPGVIRWLFQNDSNITPLMMAADSGNVKMAEHLLKAGASLKAKTAKLKMWPIDFACRREDVPMARLLLGKDPQNEERVVKIDLSEQRARIYDGIGNEILNTKVSTGKKGFATPKGVFVITDKNRDWTSTLYHAKMPYFQRLSSRDFGLHQGVVPGYAASHGCIRLPAGTAAKLFKMLQLGDRVEIAQ